MSQMVTASEIRWGLDSEATEPDRNARLQPQRKHFAPPDPKTGFRITNLIDDVVLLTRPDPEYVIEGRFVEGTAAAMVGAAGVGKTFLAIDAALSVASGRPWLGASVRRRGPVVHIVAEGAAGVKRRVLGWKRAHGFAADDRLGYFVYAEAVNFLDPSAVEAFLREVERVKPVMIFGDTLARCLVGGDENSARDVGLLVAHTDRVIRATGACFPWLHHVNKAGTGERGSTALRGAVDTLLLLSAADDLLTLSCEKQKDAAPFGRLNLRLVAAEGTCLVQFASENFDQSLSPSPAQTKLLAALRDNFSAAGATTNEWRTAVPEIPERSFYRAVKRLTDSGAVHKRRGRYQCTEVNGPLMNDEDGAISALQNSEPI